MEDSRFTRDRSQMVRDQLIPRGICDPRVLLAFETVPRHLFVPKDELDWAYSDYPLPIGFNQTISQPYIVALMTEKLRLTGSEKVLEVGTGSGYQAAILSKLAEEIHTVEIIPELARTARKRIETMGIANINIHEGDGSMGHQFFAPFDAITVTAAAPLVPRPLLEQLNDGGRMIIPVGSRGYQELVLWQRSGDSFRSETIIPVAFVPLRGHHGWEKGSFE